MDAVKGKIAEYLLSNHCEFDCNHDDFLKFAFFNLIDDLLNYERINDIATQEEIDLLESMAGVSANDVDASNGAAILTGGEVSITEPIALPLWSEPSISTDLDSFSACIRKQIADYLQANKCECNCTQDDFIKFAFLNLIDDLLHYDRIDDILTAEELALLQAVTGCVACPIVNTFSGAAIITGISCTCACTGGGGGNVEVDYPFIGYKANERTYTINSSSETWTYPNYFVAVIDNNPTAIGNRKATSLSDLVTLGNTTKLGTWTLSGAVITIVGFHEIESILQQTGIQGGDIPDPGTDILNFITTGGNQQQSLNSFSDELSGFERSGGTDFIEHNVMTGDYDTNRARLNMKGGVPSQGAVCKYYKQGSVGYGIDVCHPFDGAPVCGGPDCALDGAGCNMPPNPGAWTFDHLVNLAEDYADRNIPVVLVLLPYEDWDGPTGNKAFIMIFVNAGCTISRYVIGDEDYSYGKYDNTADRWGSIASDYTAWGTGYKITHDPTIVNLRTDPDIPHVPIDIDFAPLQGKISSFKNWNLNIIGMDADGGKDYQRADFIMGSVAAGQSYSFYRADAISLFDTAVPARLNSWATAFPNFDCTVLTYGVATGPYAQTFLGNCATIMQNMRYVLWQAKSEGVNVTAATQYRIRSMRLWNTTPLDPFEFFCLQGEMFDQDDDTWTVWEIDPAILPAYVRGYMVANGSGTWKTIICNLGDTDYKPTIKIAGTPITSILVHGWQSTGDPLIPDKIAVTGLNYFPNHSITVGIITP